jgi:radical SAM protein with 4Fe4S-binding SPASM domain
LINDNLILKIKTYSKLKYIQISLDGASAQTHDKIRGIGTFKKTINIIRKLKENQIEVRIMFTLQNCNKNDIPSLIDLALNEKIDGLTIERIVPMGASKDAMEVSLSKQEIKEIYQYISDRADSEYNKGNKLRILKYRPLWVLIDPCRLSDGSNLHKESGAICSIGLDGICILPDATVLACRRLPISIGNLKNDSLEKIWTTSELLWEIADKTNLKGKCKSCEYISKCSGCRAMAYAYTGDYLCEDPHCWLK